MARKLQVNRVSKRRTKTKIRGKKKDPLFVEGERPRPMYVDYKNLELLKKLINRQGKIISRRKSGCTAVSQHAVTDAVKRARFMALARSGLSAMWLATTRKRVVVLSAGTGRCGRILGR